MSEGQPPQVLSAESRVELLDALRVAARPVSVAEAAALLGLHPSTARFHLGLLASAGLVDRQTEHLGTAGRPRIRYVARTATGARAGSAGGGAPVGAGAPLGAGVPAGSTAATGAGMSEGAAAPVPGPSTEESYRRLADVLAGQLSGLADPAGAAREAGRRWVGALDDAPGTPGRPLAPVDALDTVAGLMDRLGFAPDRPVAGDRLLLRRCPFEAVARDHRAVVCGVHAGMLEQTFARLGDTVRVDGLEPFASSDPLLCVVRLRRMEAGGTGPGSPATAAVGAAANSAAATGAAAVARARAPRDNTAIAATHRRPPRAAPRGTGDD